MAAVVNPKPGAVLPAVNAMPALPHVPPGNAKALAAGQVKAQPRAQVQGENAKALPGDMTFIDNYCGNKRAFSTWLSLLLRDGVLYKKYRQSAGLVDTW